MNESADSVSTSPATKVRCVLLLLSIFLITGCGSGSVKTAYVDGVVTFEGKPLTNGTITFFPEGGRSATGFIQADGTFVMSTFEEEDGATPGLHKVAISSEKNAGPVVPNYENDNAVSADSGSAIPLHYGNPDQSGLTFEVKAGEENHAPFNLTAE